MKDSPFIYGTTVSEYSFTNRENESAKLLSNLLNGINTTIISPRRWGKSSLVEKVIGDISKSHKNKRTIIIDLFSVGNQEEFLEMFAKEVIKASSSKWEEWMSSGKEIFQRLIPKLSVGIDPNSDFSVRFDWEELRKNVDEILNLPETIAEKRGLEFIICLDEFQNLASFSGYPEFEKKLRAYWQRHKSVTYCLYGSKRHMMTDIFNNPAKPFYRFGDIMLLQKIETLKWISFIKEGFSNTGKEIETMAVEIIPKVMKNHSWYVQQLAHYTWNISQDIATIDEVNAALRELVNANSPLYQKEIENLSSTQINFLKAVSMRETQFTSTIVMQKYSLGTPRNVSKNKTILINADIIQEVNKNLEFVDPAFELWFNKQFFNKSFTID
ncbi:MAG: ATP-binding protein [Bacteroidetes bacterium HGW-Bacteroidetes-15]|nr:MAG: ATP-binding protein [Bacteroidetes bacterium HGW-Bacteroidetes-15]